MLTRMFDSLLTLFLYISCIYCYSLVWTHDRITFL